MRFFFDFVIFLSLIFTGYWIFWLSRSFFIHKIPAPKTKIVRLSLLFFLIIIFCIIIYAAFIEPRIIRLTQVDINLDQTVEREQIKIAFLSDPHLGPFKKSGFMDKTVDLIIKENPDLVLLGGDYIIFKEKYAAYLEPLKKLAGKLPVYAVTGNHEYNQGFYGDRSYQDKTGLLRELFNKYGIKLLENESAIVEIRGQKLALGGITDIWTGCADLNLAAANSDGLPTILLAHNPEAALYPGADKFDLILSGHTHAGQLRLPLIGALAYPDNTSREYTYGLYKINQRQLFVSAGLGESGGLRARFYNRPEIVIINLDL